MTARAASNNRMSTGLYLFLLALRWMVAIVLALWLGGLVAIGAFTAPTVFGDIRSAAATSALSAADQNALAGLLVGDTFRLFNSVCAGLTVALIFGQVFLFAFLPSDTPAKKRGSGSAASRPAQRDTLRGWLIAEFVIGLVLICSLYYLAIVLFPDMDEAKARGMMKAFDMMHKKYTEIAMGQAPVLMVMLAMCLHSTAIIGRR